MLSGYKISIRFLCIAIDISGHLQPPMSKTRISLIDAAFKKMDRTGDGIITPEDLKGVYNVRYVRILCFLYITLFNKCCYTCPDQRRSHPKFINGEKTEEEIFKEFLRTFDSPNHDGKVKLSISQSIDISSITNNHSFSL